VHWPWNPVAPFAGLYVEPDLRERFYERQRQLAAAAGLARPIYPGWYPAEAYEKTGISRLAHIDAARSLYDEGMAHNDYQLGQLVERLKAAGEWEHTLLIVAADHGYGHAIKLFDSPPPRGRPLFNSFRTRIPMIVVWPGRIAAGQRFGQPVSMIDMLPTLLELAGLPPAEVSMGQSLAPLLLGEVGWEPRPLIFDEFYVDADTGELEGTIEVIDGRWGASLSIQGGSEEEPAENEDSERPRLLLYDLWNDPYCLHSLHEERPDLVEKYTEFLEAQWEAHQALGQRFTRSGEVALTPEQLRTLRALGYIQ
jgi:arylsulfatase A-like enzyme